MVNGKAIVYAIVVVWVVLATTVAQDIAAGLYPSIYTSLDNWPCVRALNATHTVGCHSQAAMSGILFQLNAQEDLNRFINESPQEAFALVIPYKLLTKANISALRSTGKLAGLIVLLHESSTAIDTPLQSPDGRCPNCELGLYANDSDRYTWNPQAEGLLDEAFDFAIYALNPTDNYQATVYNSIKLAAVYNQNRGYGNYPLKAVEFNSFMWAAVNSGTCLRRGWCQAIGGLSVYSSPSRDMTADDGKPIIILTAELDSRSLFPEMTIGLERHVSGMVTVLAVAEALSRAPVPVAQLHKHILYTLFSAESWGFAGSQRFVQDIAAPFQCTNATRATPCPFSRAPCTFPCVRDLGFKRINLENIESIFEFQSVAGINSNYSAYFAHVDDIERSGPLVNRLKQNQHTSLRSAYEDGVQRRLPPSSAMSFLAKRRDIQAVVVSDFESDLGRYYNSDMDDTLDVDPMARSICNLATTTAQTVYNDAHGEMSLNSTDNSVAANCSLVHSLLVCLVSNFSCPLMQQYFNVSNVGRLSHSASALDVDSLQPSILSRFAFSYLGSITGQRREGAVCQTIHDCQLGEYCFLQQCTMSMTAYHAAYGTGLQFNEASGKMTVIDPTKATWTESIWNPPTLRVFLVTSRTHQIVELVVGILWTSASIATVISIQRYLHKAFKLD